MSKHGLRAADMCIDARMVLQMGWHLVEQQAKVSVAPVALVMGDAEDEVVCPNMCWRLVICGYMVA